MNPITQKLQADKLIRMALEEDITSEDVSTNAVMPDYKKGKVQLLCKQDGVICGLGVFLRTFELLDENTTAEFFVRDGDEVKKGQLLAEVTGDIRVLLSGERVALNYLQRMSGVATYTRAVAKLLEGSETKLLDTRKTTPNMRVFEKYAVRVGGGNNHRYNLSDGVLLKDNHIGAAGGVAAAVKAAKAYAPFVRKIEIEVETPEQLKEALDAGADDYITKPYSLKELAARVYAQIRRNSMKGFVIDHQNQLLQIDNRIIPLAQKEFELFLFLLGNSGRILSAAELYQEVWRTGKADAANTVAVHITRLRHKLEETESVIGRIETVRGEGYRFLPRSEAGIRL